MQIVRDNCGLRITDMIGKMELSQRCSRSTLPDTYIFRYNLSRIVGNLTVILDS